MTDRPAYMIANLTIADPSTHRIYEQGFMPLLKRHGGELLAVDEKTETLEGSTALGGRVVILKFPSAAKARGWFEDPDYQALSAHRRAASQALFITLVHSLPA